MSVYSIVQKGLQHGVVETRNIHYYEFPGYVPSLTELQEFVDEVDDAIKDNLEAEYSDNYLVYGYDVRRLDIANLPTVFFVPTLGEWMGNEPGDNLPSQIAALVTWKAPTAYPRSTRNYIAAFTETANTTAGFIATSTLTALDNFANRMYSIPITGQSDAVKVACKVEGTPPVATDWNTVTFHVINNVFRTQRRRVRGVGI